MRPRKLLLIGVALTACVVSTGADARPRFPAILGAFAGTFGGMIGLRHAVRSRHHAHRPRARDVRRASLRATERQAAIDEPRVQAASSGSGQSGWTGAVFWPHLYDDLFEYVFWPSGTDDRIWAYGYGDIVEAMFPPRSGHADSRVALQRASQRTMGGAGDENSVGAAQTCTSNKGAKAVDALIERIEQTVQPTEVQQQSLAALRPALQRAFEYINEACATTEGPAVQTARLDSMDDRLWAARQALLVTRAPVDAFYGSLSDEQKTRLNGSSPQADQRVTCGRQGADLPAAQIERRVRANQEQRAAWEALRMTSFGMARLLQASCPVAMPATPIERLDAADKRLNSLLYAVANLRAPFEAFQASGGNGQKSRVSTVSQ